MKEVAQFYDRFSSSQLKTGINLRHRTIFRELKKNGLKREDHVLEIGCGIGTVTRLLAGYLTRGSVLGVDISPENIRIAQGFVRKQNAKFMVSDMTDFRSERKFDCIVLPDVLEHIPFGQHPSLFQVLGGCSHDDTTVFINIPSPHFQNYISRTNPSLQQIIDLELHTDRLLSNAYAGGFRLHSMKTYSLGYAEGDYQQIILKRQVQFESMRKLSKRELILKEIRSRLPF